MYLRVGDRTYYLVTFLDEYSRQIVHHALVPSMDGATASVEAQAAIEQFLERKGARFRPQACRAMRTDNGSCYISREFRGVLDEHQLGHQRIKPHCPEENGIIERSNRTLREALDGEELTNLFQAREKIGGIIRWYNRRAIAFSLGLSATDRLLPGRSRGASRTAAPEMVEARHKRKQKNLQLRQPTLPLECTEGLANGTAKMSHCG